MPEIQNHPVIDVTAEVIKPKSRKRPSRAKPRAETKSPAAPRRRKATEIEATIALELSKMYFANLAGSGEHITIVVADDDGNPTKKKVLYSNKKAILYVYGFMLKMVQGIV